MLIVHPPIPWRSLNGHLSEASVSVLFPPFLPGAERAGWPGALFRRTLLTLTNPFTPPTHPHPPLITPNSDRTLWARDWQLVVLPSPSSQDMILAPSSTDLVISTEWSTIAEKIALLHRPCTVLNTLVRNAASSLHRAISTLSRPSFSPTPSRTIVIALRTEIRLHKEVILGRIGTTRLAVVISVPIATSLIVGG